MDELMEILNDAQFGDDTSFDYNGKKIPMSKIRALRANFTAEEQRIAGIRSKAEKDAMESARILGELIEREKNNAPPPPAKGSDEWEKDPLYAPVLAKFNPVFEAVKKVNENLERQQKNWERAQAIYAIDRMRGEFNRYADKDGKVKGKTFEELAQEAVKSNTLDGLGAPTLAPLVERLLEPDRREEYAQGKIKEERAKWETEQRAASSSKPGSSAKFRTQKDEKAPISKIDELDSNAVLKEIQNDPKFAEAMAGGKVQ